MNKSKEKGDLLLEFFTEEIPARMQENSEIQLKKLFEKSTAIRNIHYDVLKTYSGPRHLSLIIKKIDLKQKDQKIEKRGPRLEANEKAIEGFLKSNNIKLTETYIKKTNNGEFYFCFKTLKGLKTADVLSDIVNEIINSFTWPKSQRWANSDVKWARPLRNILLLLNNKVVNGKVILGKNEILNFNNYTFGHRDNNKKIVVKNICDYKNLLKKNHIILDRDDRRNIITRGIQSLLDKKDITLEQDETLLNEILGLVEFPNILIGSISNEFMSLPAEVLSTAMKKHQKYFSIIDKKNNLIPKFLFVSNSVPEKQRDLTIIEGNEKVLKARLSDANYFWKTDISNTFENWNEKLKNVLFYEGLGSLHDKITRMSKISNNFACYFDINKNLVKEAVNLSKADLVSEMVNEFPELQGIMGGYYAKLKGKPKEVSIAIYEHYKPKGISDDIPKTKLGSLLSIVDKIDTLTSFFVIGKNPSGSKDPFALRRCGFSIVQVLIKSKLNISFNDVFSLSLSLHNNFKKNVETSLIGFIIDKLKFILKGQKISADIIDSVLTLKNIENIPFQIIIKRIDNLNIIRGNKSFQTFLINFKRLNNILKNEQILEKSNSKIDTTLFEETLEEKLHKKIRILINKIDDYEMNLKSQKILLKYLIDLQKPINLYLENIKVNHKDINVKNNRLILLKLLHHNITRFSNFNLIEN